MKQKIIFSLLIFSFCFCATVFAQMPQGEKISKYITPPFVSDGQRYITLISAEEAAEFQVTFFAQSTYRIALGLGDTDKGIIFTVYDTDYNELFSNADFENSPFWDFKFTNTTNCIIEAKIADGGPKSGFAVMQIGYRK